MIQKLCFCLLFLIVLLAIPVSAHAQSGDPGDFFTWTTETFNFWPCGGGWGGGVQPTDTCDTDVFTVYQATAQSGEYWQDSSFTVLCRDYFVVADQNIETRDETQNIILLETFPKFTFNDTECWRATIFADRPGKQEPVRRPEIGRREK